MRILYVEDAVEFRRHTVAQYLHDADVTEVSNVHAALMVIGANGPLDFDVVMLDFELPDGTGLDVLRAIRTRAPDVRVVGVSADRNNNRALLDAGANDSLTKSRFSRLRELLGLEALPAP